MNKFNINLKYSNAFYRFESDLDLKTLNVENSLHVLNNFWVFSTWEHELKSINQLLTLSTEVKVLYIVGLVVGFD